MVTIEGNITITGSEYIKYREMIPFTVSNEN